MAHEEQRLWVRQEHLKSGAVLAPKECAFAAWRPTQHARILDVGLCNPIPFLASVHAQQVESLILQAIAHDPHHTQGYLRVPCRTLMKSPEAPSFSAPSCQTFGSVKMKSCVWTEYHVHAGMLPVRRSYMPHG